MVGTEKAAPAGRPRRASAPRAVRRYVALLGLVAALTGLASAPADAHSGTSEIRLAVAGDASAAVVQALVVYAGDHEPVVDEFVLAALSGPQGERTVRLTPDRSAPGLYTARVHLPAGRWVLRVATLGPTVGTATGEVHVAEAGHVRGLGLSASFDPGRLGDDGPQPVAGRVLAGAAALAVVLLALSAVAVRRRRRLLALTGSA